MHLAKDMALLLGLYLELWSSRGKMGTSFPWPVFTAESRRLSELHQQRGKASDFPTLSTGFLGAFLLTCKTCEFVAFLVWFVIGFDFVFELASTIGGKGGAGRRFGLSNLLGLFPLWYLWIMYWTDGKNVEYVHYELYSPVCCLEY